MEIAGKNLKPIYHFDIVQGTQEWFDIRNLKFTASKASIVSANGKGLETLVKEMLAEYFSSQEFEEYTGKFKSEQMQRGNDFEDMARTVYQFETGNVVKEVGCCTVGNYILASPDGLVEENGKDEGLIEIKNHSDKVFLELVLTEKIDPKYIAQMQYQLWVTGRKWVDYFGFNPNFKPNYFKVRLYPDLEMHKKFEKGVLDGIEMIENGLNILETKLGKRIHVVDLNQKKIEEKENKIEVVQNDDFPF